MSDRALATTQKQTATRVTPSISGFLQRKCACGNHTVAGGECEGCKDKKGMLQRRPANESSAGEVPPIVHEVVRSPGQPLDPATRGFMEPRFGHDFSQVRVHTDAAAAESARAVNALAYTVGRNMVFEAGQYSPRSIEGQRLLTHELTHVVQQGESAHTQRRDATIGPAQDAHEREAERVAQLIDARRDAARVERLTAQPALQRQPAPPKDDAKKKPGEKEAITQPPPQKIPAPEAKQEGKEKKGVELSARLGVENETKSEAGETKTEVAGKFSFEVVIPITDKLKLGPISFLKEASVEASAGLKSGESKPVTSLELETTVKVISLDFEKVKVPLGIADFGISGSPLAGAELSSGETTGAAKFGFAGEGEAKFKRSEKSPFFITVKGGVEKTYDKEGNAEFKWSPLKWKTGVAAGVEF